MSSRPWPVAALLAVLVAASACGIQNDTGPRNIPADELGELPTGDDAGQATGGSTLEIFLLESRSPAELRGVPRDVGESPSQLFEALLAGPTESDRTASRLRTALPADLELLTPPTVRNSIAYVNVSDAIFDITGSSLIDALAQIVFTMTELPNIDAVRLLVDGVPQEWPTDDGSLTAAPLTVYDYPSRNPTSQPSYPMAPPVPPAA